MSAALVLLIITNGIWGLAAIAAVWALLHFGKLKVSSPTQNGSKSTAAKKDPAVTSDPAEADKSPDLKVATGDAA